MWFCVWSHVGHIPNSLLLTSGEMEGISGGAAGGDGCKGHRQKVEQAHHLQLTEESEDEKSGGQSTTPEICVYCVAAKLTHFYKVGVAK